MTSLTVEFLRIPIKVHFLGINLSPVKQEFRNTKYREFLGSPVVRTQYSHHQSPNYTLVGELRACKLRGISPPTKKKKKRKRIQELVAFMVLTVESIREKMRCFKTENNTI